MGLQIFMKVSINGGDPKWSISIVLFIINHPFWGMPMYGTPHIWIHTCKCVIMVNQSWFISRLANGLCPIASSSWGISVYLSIHASMHPSMHPSIHPSVRPSIHPMIYLSNYLSMCLSICLGIYRTIAKGCAKTNKRNHLTSLMI